MKKVGIIGCGNMGSAMLNGMLKSKMFSPDQIAVYHRRKEAAGILKERFGIKIAANYKELLDECDVVILGIKPGGFASLIAEIKDDVRQDQIIVSIAAGNSVSQIETWFERPVKLIRLMPNTPAMVNEGMTAIMKNDNITQEELDFIVQLCDTFGKSAVVEETLIDAVTAVSGSSPAYVYMFIEALADGAVQQGMKREMAYEFAAQAVLGSAKMVLETHQHPGVLKDAVCSPGGTTIAAVASLERSGFRAAVMNAVAACAQRSREMKK